MAGIVEKYLWVEKYRPRILEDMVLPEEYNLLFKKFVDEKEIPHLLLYGPPGSGKTTIAKILIKEILSDKSDLLILNGSSSTGIDVVRGQIEDFLKSPCFGFGSKTKIIFIDEADYLSQNAQAALRNMMETYHQSGRFILTCNYLFKIIEPLQSRCQSFEFKKLSKQFIFDFCKNILQSEKIEFDELSLQKVITNFYPDVRKVVNTLQSRSADGKLSIQGKDIESNERLFKSYILEIIDCLRKNDSMGVNNQLSNIQKFLANNDLDYINIYEDLFLDETIPIWMKIVINKYANNHIESLIPQMNMMSMIFESLKIANELKALKK